MQKAFLPARRASSASTCFRPLRAIVSGFGFETPRDQLMLWVVQAFIVLLAFHFFGDGLRDAADPYSFM
jgi:hypothetical protein